MVAQLRCRQHGGSSPQAKHAAIRRQAQGKAAQIVLGTRWAQVENPLTALQELAGEILGWRDVLRDQVRQLGDLTATDFAGVERARAVAELYERSLDRAESILVALSRLNLSERLVKITERQAEVIVLVIESTLKDLGLDPAQQEAGRGIAASHLRLLEGQK